MPAATKSKSAADWSGWDYVPGIAFIVIGVFSIMAAQIASLATGIYLALMLCVAGVFGFVGGLAHIKQRGAWLAALLGLLTLIVGILVLYNPVAGAISLVWLLGAWFIAGGLLELVTAFGVPFGRRWLIFVGLIDVALGVFVVAMKPEQAFLFLGSLVGLSFVFRGLWNVIFVGGVHRGGHVFEEAVA